MTARVPLDTELGHATSLMARHPQLRYAAGLGWLSWNGARWAPNAEPELTAAVHAAAIAYHAIAPGPFANALCSRKGLDDVAEICRDVPGTSVDPSALDSCQGLLHTAGVTWDMRTGTAWPSDRNELSTRATTSEPAETVEEDKPARRRARR